MIEQNFLLVPVIAFCFRCLQNARTHARIAIMTMALIITIALIAIIIALASVIRTCSWSLHLSSHVLFCYILPAYSREHLDVESTVSFSLPC